MLLKAAGFPIWTGSTTSIPPGGWRSLDSFGQYALLLDVPVFRGIVRVLGQTIGSLPFPVFTEDAQGRLTRSDDHQVYPLLHDSPNAFMTSMEWRQTLILDWCLGGNGYSEIVKLGNRIVSLNPLPAERMHPQFVDGKFIYRFSNFGGKQTDFLPEQIIHIKNPTSNGYVGMPHVPISLVQRAVDTHAYGANFMRHQGRPSGILTSDQAPPANDETGKKMRADWEEKFSGPANAGKTAVLWKNLKYQAISSTPEEAQYNETIKQLNAEFAGIFGIPLNMLDQTDKTATFASAEQFDIQYVKHVARPIARMFEQAINKKLFPKEPNVFCRMDLKELLRGDSQAQAAYYGSMVTNGIMDRDQAARELDMPERGGSSAKLTVQRALTFPWMISRMRSQIRKQVRTSTHRSSPMKLKTVRLEIKDITAEGSFKGYASTFGNKDLGDDIVMSGAFTKTLQENQNIPILWGHSPREVVGVNKNAYEDAKGLYVEGQLAMDVQRAKEAHSLMKMNAVNGLSIGYDPVVIDWSREKEGIRILREVKLYEYSLTPFPMNEQATITGVKSIQDLDEILHEIVIRAKRSQGELSAETKASIEQAIETLSALRAAQAPGAAKQDDNAPALVHALFDRIEFLTK